MTPREQRLAQAAQVGWIAVCMPVPPPAERDWRCGASVAWTETLARIDEAGRRFAQRLQQAHTPLPASLPNRPLRLADED